MQLSYSWLNSFFRKKSVEYNSTIHLFTKIEKRAMCMINISMGGKGGGWGGGLAVKDAWSGLVGVGVIKGSLQKHLKTGVGKGKSCS